MRNYRVELWFEDYAKPEISYHYDCENGDEAIAEALEWLDGVWVDIVNMIEWDEI